MMALFGVATPIGARCGYCALCDILRAQKESDGEVVSIADCYRHKARGPAHRKRLAEEAKHRGLDRLEQAEHDRAQRAKRYAPPEDPNKP